MERAISRNSSHVRKGAEPIKTISMGPAAMVRSRSERLDFWHWVFSYRRKYRPQLLAKFSQHAPNANLMIFSSLRELQGFIDGITKHRPES